MDIITANSGLKLASNNINLEVLEHFSFEVISILQKNSDPFLALILKTSTSAMDNHCTL